MLSLPVHTKSAKKIGVVVLCALYFASMLWLTVGTHEPVSPDERANWFFAQRVAAGEPLAYEEPLAEVADNGIHPRSTVSLGGRIVPTSFVGMPVLTGAVGWLLGDWAIRVVTPVLALLGVLAWSGVVARVFGDRRLAMLSALALAIMPAYWFYAGRTMMHNVPFVALGIVAAWFAVVRPISNKRFAWVNELASGIALALSLSMRTSELVWIAPAVMILVLVALIKKWWNFKQLGLFVLGGVLVMAPILMIQNDLYGSPLASGYTVTPELTVTPAEPPRYAEVTQADYPGLLGVLLPFGFHERPIIRNSWNYLVAIAPHLAIITGLGVFFALRESRKDRTWRYWLAGLALITAWLVAVYGSWVFYDNADRTLITIGNSYMRYWLPIFVLSTPLIAKALLAIKSRAFITLVLVTMLTWNAMLVFDGQDGFISARKTIVAAHATSQEIFALTEPNSVIITDTEDKYLFPDRKVLQPLRRERTYALMPSIVKNAPLYYYGISLPQEDIDFLMEQKLVPLGLAIEHVETFGALSLYRIFTP